MAEVPDNPDRPCTACGTRDWRKYEEKKPTNYPDASDVVKHFFACTKCNADGFAYAEGGHIRFTGKLR